MSVILSNGCALSRSVGILPATGATGVGEALPCPCMNGRPSRRFDGRSVSSTTHDATTATANNRRGNLGRRFMSLSQSSGMLDAVKVGARSGLRDLLSGLESAVGAGCRWYEQVRTIGV